MKEYKRQLFQIQNSIFWNYERIEKTIIPNWKQHFLINWKKRKDNYSKLKIAFLKKWKNRNYSKFKIAFFDKMKEKKRQLFQIQNGISWKNERIEKTIFPNWK